MPLKSLLIVALVALMVGGVGLWGCATASQEVALEQLFAEPESYDGEDVILEGFFFSFLEANILAEGLEYSAPGDWRLTPTGRRILIEGAIAEVVLDSLYQQPAGGTVETFGKIRIEGKFEYDFEYGNAYGHLGSYSYRITPVEATVLPWSPDELGPPPEPPQPILETITPQAASDLIEANQSNPDFIIIDVRGATSYAEEHIENAVNMDSTAEDFEVQLETLDKDRVYLVYCAIGRRSAAAGETMSGLGFNEVYVIEGGIAQWKAEELPTITQPS
jgi:rhodanese-related sulfurtransferase